MHIPDSGQQLVRYYGAFSNAHRAPASAPSTTTAAAEGAHRTPQDDSDIAAVVMAPVIRETITGSSAAITGKFTKAEAERIANGIR